MFETIYYNYDFHKAILRINCQVHQEATDVFYRENLFVCFTISSPEFRLFLRGSENVLFLSHSDSMRHFGGCAMDIIHHCPERWTSTSFLLVNDQLPNLLRTLRAYSQQLDQSLAKGPFSVRLFEDFGRWSTETQPRSFPVPTRIQSLLEPFELLYGVESLDIKGAVDEDYKQSVIRSATQQEPTVAEIITAASAIKNRGDEAFRETQYNLALSLYTSALRDFQVNRHCFEYTGSLTTGEFSQMSTAHAVRSFPIRLHLCLAAALVKVCEYKRAIDHAKMALKQIVTREAPPEEWEGFEISADEIGRALFWIGMAQKGLGDFPSAKSSFRLALKYHPEELMEESGRLEAGLE